MVHAIRRRKLEETHGEIVQVRCEVIEALRSFYSNASGISVDEAIKIASKWTINRHHSYDPLSMGASAPRSDLQEKIERLHESLLTTVDQLQVAGGDHAAPQAKLVFSFTQRERLKRQMEQSKEMLTLIEKLTEIDRILGEIDGHMDTHQLVHAAHGVKEAQNLLSVLMDGDSGRQQQALTSGNAADPGAQENIAKIIQLQIVKKKNQLMLKLKQIHATTILWKERALKVSHARLEDTLRDASSLPDEQLRDFWTACEIMGVLPDKLKELAKSLSQHLLKPSLQNANVVINLSRESSDAVLKLVRGEDKSAHKKSEVAQAEEKCSHIVSILYFVHSEVFLGDAELMNQLGGFLWKIPGNLEAQLMSLLQEKIPQDAAALNSYRETLIVAVSRTHLFAVPPLRRNLSTNKGKHVPVR